MAENNISIDKNLFHNRLASFLSHWRAEKRNGSAIFGGVGSIVIPVGKASTEGYSKSGAFQIWLLSYEFPATLLVLTPDGLLVVTTKKKASYLEPLKGGKTPIEILIRGKDREANQQQFQTCIDRIQKAGKNVGILLKETNTGQFAEEWKQAFDDAKGDFKLVDISLALSSAALSIKDQKELRAIRDASRASSGLEKGFFLVEMTEIIDQEKKITHKALADMVKAKIDDGKFFKQIKVSPDFDPLCLDWAMEPVIQGGGNYDLKFSSESDEKILHDGIIISAFGLRYQSYSSLIARTYLVEPTKSQEKTYKLLLKTHNAVLSTIKDGVAAKDVYLAALDVIQSNRPELENNFVRSVGAGIGIELRDPTLVLNAKCNRVLRDGMTLAITVGLFDVVNPESKEKNDRTYSLVITDTVRVAANEAVVFTKVAPLDFDSVAFFFEDEQKAPSPVKKVERDSRASAAIAKANITSTRLRHHRQTYQNEEKEALRRERQKEFHRKRQQEGLERFGKGSVSINGIPEKKIRRFESYKRDNLMPPGVKDLRILVDHKSSTILLPIFGRPVPFHIHTVKTASTAAEGDSVTLRINFLSPGQGVGRKDEQPLADLNAHFVRSITFKSKDRVRFEDLARQITELKKEAHHHEQELKQMEDVIEQDKLALSKDRKVPRLEPLFLRPVLDGKRVHGCLEIHTNGLRYVHGVNMGQVDILFSNIKHLFFQPCAHELIVLIHAHLINPIMIGKKKTRDVQFFREATEMQFDETGNRKRKHRYGDDEEFEAEQEERRQRAELDKEFHNFTRKIEEAARGFDLHADIPIRELGFNGVPSRSSVWMQPTTDCLAQLTEPPFFVVTLTEIEVVHFERVQVSYGEFCRGYFITVSGLIEEDIADWVKFGLKNFDMVIVFRDFSRPVSHINTIPVESLDAVKDWLDSVEIPFSEGPLNLNWTTIMKTVTADPHKFFVDGGWSFLWSESDSEDEGDEEEESAFELSDSKLGSDESSEEDSEYDENASAEDEEAGSEEEEEEEGEDWTELEAQAKIKDRENGRESGHGAKSSKGNRRK